MPRIAQEDIDRIKRETSIADLVRLRGIELRGHGENLIGLCPFHDDHEPSLIVTPSKNLWHCLGACNEGGDVIRWVERSEHVPFRRAVELLHRGYPEFASAQSRPTREERPPCPLSLEMADAEMLGAVVRYYHERLGAPDNIEAVTYLQKRGIFDQEAIDRFQIGVADRTLGLTIPDSNYKTGRLLRERLMNLGIYRADSAREHFNGCIVFPVFGADGSVAEIYGRKVRDDIRHRVGWHLYLPGPHRGIWNREALAESKEIIVCEAIIDALTFWIAGYRNVVAAFGVNGFTEEMFEAVTVCGIERVLVAYDRDEAGDKAAAQLASRLGAEGIACYRVLFPRMMDANEYAKKVQPASNSLGILLRSAEWIGGPKTRGEVSAAVVRHPHAVIDDAPRIVTPSTVVPEPVLSLAAPLAAVPEEIPGEEQPPAEEVRAETADPESIEISCGDRLYRVRGLEKNLTYAQMKVVVRVARGESMFVDQFDLISARPRAQFVRQASTDLGLKEEVIKRDVAGIYRELEGLQEKMIKKTLEPKETTPALRDDEIREAMDLLRDPNFLMRVLADYETCGVVGERTNKLMAFISAASRLLDDPLAIIIQSSSAAGKTKLMDAVLDFIPEEQRVRYSAMTGQSLFYFDGTSLKHKILAISEEEGAERAAYALKLLQSEGQLTIASTGKDPQTGRLVTQEYRVEGPVMIFLTTTSAEIDEELLNRCIVLTVDEDRAQTRAIHRLQREGETLEGMLVREDRQHVLRLHRNAQRLLRPIRVVNPYARELTFLDGRTRTRRDHMKYLTLIRTIALLHQHQRPRKSYAHRGRSIEYIEVTPADIALANELANEVLGRSLDELPPQTRHLVEVLGAEIDREATARKMERVDVRFFQRDVRSWTGWTDFQVKVHLRKLVEMEYVLIHRGGRGQSFVYELVYDGRGKDGKPFLPGLINVSELTTTNNREHPKGEWEHPNSEWEGPGSGQVAAGEHSGSEGEIAPNSNTQAPLPRIKRYSLQKTHHGNGDDGAPSYSSASYPLVMTPSGERS